MKIKVTDKYERPDGTIGTRTEAEDLISLRKRIFIRIRKLMSDDANRTIIPGVNAYNYGKYEEALEYFQIAISICPQVMNEIQPHVAVCKRVIAKTRDAQDLLYKESLSQWESKPRPIKWLFRLFGRSTPIFQIRCKYCGHYTPYIDPNYGWAYIGQNNCVRCGRGYPMPDFDWDSIDGQAYIYYRGSVSEEKFYKEFERRYDVNPDRYHSVHPLRNA